MKTINIRKSTQFSEDSKIVVHSGLEKVRIRGFDPRPVKVDENQEIYASHQWAQSNRISYDKLDNGSTYIIMPKLTKGLAFTIFIVLMICAAVFIFTKSRWSFTPLIPFAVYIFIYLTLLRKKYLIIEPYS